MKAPSAAGMHQHLLVNTSWCEAGPLMPTSRTRNLLPRSGAGQQPAGQSSGCAEGRGQTWGPFPWGRAGGRHRQPHGSRVGVWRVGWKLAGVQSPLLFPRAMLAEGTECPKGGKTAPCGGHEAGVEPLPPTVPAAHGLNAFQVPAGPHPPCQLGAAAALDSSGEREKSPSPAPNQRGAASRPGGTAWHSLAPAPAEHPREGPTCRLQMPQLLVTMPATPHREGTPLLSPLGQPRAEWKSQHRPGLDTR